MTVMGKCKVLDTPAGQILRSLVDAGVKDWYLLPRYGLRSASRWGRRLSRTTSSLSVLILYQSRQHPGAFMALSESKLMNEQVQKNNKIINLMNEIVGE